MLRLLVIMHALLISPPAFADPEKFCGAEHIAFVDELYAKLEPLWQKRNEIAKQAGIVGRLCAFRARMALDSSREKELIAAFGEWKKNFPGYCLGYEAVVAKKHLYSRSAEVRKKCAEKGIAANHMNKVASTIVDMDLAYNKNCPTWRKLPKSKHICDAFGAGPSVETTETASFEVEIQDEPGASRAAD
jgi:hypothetical protein